MNPEERQEEYRRKEVQFPASAVIITAKQCRRGKRNDRGSTSRVKSPEIKPRNIARLPRNLMRAAGFSKTSPRKPQIFLKISPQILPLPAAETMLS